MTMADDTATEWRRHWRVVLAGTAGVALSTINVYSIGLYFQPLQRAFGWTRAEISAGPLIAGIAAILFAPPMGALIDRVGPRRIGIAGAVGVCAATALLGLTGPGIRSWWAAWSLLAVVNLFIQPTVWTAGAAGYFAAGRGLAFAVILCGSGIGSLAIPPLAFALIARFGWRLGFAGTAAVWAIVAIPIVATCLTSRTDRERRAPRAAGRAAARARIPAGGILLSRTFPLLALAALLIATVVVSFAVSIVPILTSNGIGRGTASGIAAMLGLTSIAGRLAIGSLLDRFDGRWLAAASVCVPIASSLILIGFPGSIVAAAVATLVLGFALGTELDLVAYLASRHFAVEGFGLTFGTLGGTIGLAGALGPWLTSLVYDHAHSYRPALWAAIPLCLGSALLFLRLGPYPTRAPAT